MKEILSKDNKPRRFDTWFDRLATAYTFGRTPIFLALVLFTIHQFLVTVSRVNGTSMEPALRSGQYVVVDKASLYVTDIFRGDIVIVRFPGDPQQVRYVKRVVGLSGELVEIKDQKLYVNGKLTDEWYLTGDGRPPMQPGHWSLGQDQLFLLGDNRQFSSDSRVFGPVERRFIVGRVY